MKAELTGSGLEDLLVSAAEQRGALRAAERPCAKAFLAGCWIPFAGRGPAFLHGPALWRQIVG